MSKSKVNLYWVTTEDQDEDWFILARSSRSAEAFHVRYEGYESGYAKAKMILRNVEHEGRAPIHAQLRDLKRFGFKICDTGDRSIRQVRYNGRVSTEGLMESLVREGNDNLAESMGHGRPGVTKPSIV